MTAFAGIDFDSHAVHVVLLPEGDMPAYSCYELGKKGDAFDRARLVRDAMPSRSWWLDEGVVAVGLEEPMGQSTRPLNRVQGAILACLPPSLLVQPLQPNEWRVAVDLPGNASKDDVARFTLESVADRWMESTGSFADAIGYGWPQDACDAYCLALAVEKVTVFS